MDYHCGGFSASNAINNKCENTVNNVNENWGTRSTNQAVAAIEKVVWDTKTSFDIKLKSVDKAKLFQFEAANQPPNKRARNSPLPDWMASDRSRAIGEIFYKTKLCCEFEVGTCPFMNNCNYAHGIEELRELPPNLEEIVAAHEEEQVELLEPREVFQRQNHGFVDEAPLSEEGYQYVENCYSTHYEHYEDRVSEAICLLPGTGSKSKFSASNWKTRICNKWELTGWCHFGEQCRFAHGSAELRCYGGVPVNTIAGDSSTFDATQTDLPAKASIGMVNGLGPRPVTCVPSSNHVGAPSRSLPNVMQKKSGEIPTRRWKGPDKISKIYGDWIDDL